MSSAPVEEKFWLNGDLSVLTKKWNILPSEGDSIGAKLNAFTRLLILGTIILTIFGWEKTPLMFLAGMIIIISIAYRESGKQGFTITPTYLDSNVNNITVSPLYAEEWQVNPPSVDYTISSAPDVPEFKVPQNPQERPYGQYLTNTNFLPRDDEYVQAIGTKNGAISFMNNAFLRNDLAFRDNMTRIQKLKLKSQFRHNSHDTFSPYSGN